VETGLFRVYLLFYNQDDRDSGAEVRTATTAAATDRQAARQAVASHRGHSSRKPHEIRVAPLPSGVVLWSGQPVYPNSTALDGVFGHKAQVAVDDVWGEKGDG
jgi:hypothetical protein